MPNIVSSLAMVAILVGTPSALAQLPAFPGALGHGANATGGRAGTVYHVTTLADSAPGSFRTAVSSANRIVVFDVGGYINLVTAVSVRENITIAGQTAPGGGIGFRGGEISFANRNNIIVRHVRILPGDDTASTGDDCLSFYRATNIICDHVSLEFGPWNNIDGVSDDWQNYPVTAITVQNSIIANPTGQQFGAHTEGVNGTWSWYYNVFANSHNRNPLAKINTVFVNNVLYNYDAGYTTHTSTEFSHDIVNNYFIFGPASTGTDNTWFQVDNNQSIFYSGNLKDNNLNGVLDGAITTPYWYQGGAGGTVLSAPWSPLTTNVPAYSPATAYRIALSQAGALPRAPVDNLVINQMKTLGQGTTGWTTGTVGPSSALYTSQTQTGLPNSGYGVINGGVAPLDADGDGMPDFWERALGLNSLANDAMTIAASGYANIEHYLNWLAEPHALTVTNTPVDVDLWTYTSGFTNASPVYSVNALSNGVATLLGDGHTARFTPAVNFSGLAAFVFAVNAADATGFTNILQIVVSPLTPPSNLRWRGDGAANLWATGSGSNWLNGETLVAFSAGDNVVFDDDGSNAPAINLSGPLACGNVYVVAAQDYVFGGSGYLSGPTALFKTGSGKLTLNNANSFAGGTTINEGVVQLGDGASVNGNLSGNVTNHDELIFANPTALSSSANVSGRGTLTKTGAGVLTLTGDQSYTNLTSINAGALEFSGKPPTGGFVNNASLVFKPTGVAVVPGVIDGPGSVVVNNSGATVYLTGANSFTGGLTNNAGNLILSNNAAAGTGPVVYNASSGSVMVGGGVVITNDFTVAGSAFTDLMLQGTNGTGVWAGNVVNLGTSAQFRPGADTGGALVFTGNALLGSRYFIVPRGSVTIASNAVMTTTQTGCAFGRDGSGGNRSANVTIRDNASLTLGGCNLGGGLAGGNVTVTLQNNAVLNCGAGSFDVQNVNRTTAITSMRLNGGTLIVGGFTKTKTSQTNVLVFNGGVLKAGANNAAFLPAFSVGTNYVQAGGAKIDDGGFAVTLAGPMLHDPALGPALDGGLIKSGAGTVTLSYLNSYNGPTVVSAGALVFGAAPAAPVFNSTNIHVAAGARLDTTGLGTFILGSGRTLWGNGSVRGAFVITNGAVLAPGSNAIGRLTFSNHVAFASGCTNLIELGKAPFTNDSVKVFGTLNNGGTLIVTNLSGALAPGDTFRLFEAANYAGAFGLVLLPDLATGLVWNTNQLNTAGVISVSLRPPNIANLSVTGGNLILSGSNGLANGNYYVLGTTNLALPLSNWVRLATNQFDVGGGFNLTNPLDRSLPRQFLRLQLQP